MSYSVLKEEMGSVQTLVCVKEVKQDVPVEWDEGMPLPGDIIEGVAEEGDEEFFMPTKARSELNSQLGKLNKQAEVIWVKVSRGENSLKLRACIVLEKAPVFQKRFTIRAASDNRHVAVIADLTPDQCTELQEMSRTVVNVDCRSFKKKGVMYNWKKKMGMILPDQRSTIISSILFMPLEDERCVEATTSRSMTWFSAAVSSGVPLVFVNIQTEQIVTAEKGNFSGKEIKLCKQQGHNTTIQILQGIRLWFLPGIQEVPLELTPEPRETRFGMDIKRTEEGFICIYSVTKGLAADRAGLRHLHEQANANGRLVIISRVEGKSLMPSTVTSVGLIHCCDHNEVKAALSSAIARMDTVQLHVMAWATRSPQPSIPQVVDAATIMPPDVFHPSPTFIALTTSAFTPNQTY